MRQKTALLEGTDYTAYLQVALCE